MAAPPAQRMNDLCSTLVLALLVATSLLNPGVMAQEEEVVRGSEQPVWAEGSLRGDMIFEATEKPEPQTSQGQVLVFPTVTALDPVDQATGAAAAGEGGEEEGEAKEEALEEGGPGGAEEPEPVTQNPVLVAAMAETQAPQPARGDGPDRIPKTVPDVMCVTKEAVQDRDAVSLKLKSSSRCEETMWRIASVSEELCGEECKLELFQEENSNQILVTGQYVEVDAAGMADKFNNDNIKDKVGVDVATPRWGKSSKLVLVAVLLCGLLLAALLVAGYYLKTHRKNAKGVRLAESFQVDEENQANTLVSVAPLPQEPADKPAVNGESGPGPAPENGTGPAPATNGHSAAQTPVADTEM